MLTDQNEMLELMKHNIDLNQVENKATASILNWYVRFKNLDLLQRYAPGFNAFDRD